MPASPTAAATWPDQDPELDALLRTWLHGWAAARALPAPLAHGEGMRVEVGWPEQLRRFVFPRIGTSLRALGEAIVEPWVFLKACAPVETMREALPARWTVQPQTWLMIHDARLSPHAPLPDGYSLALAAESASTTLARVVAPDGEPAAEGRVALIDDAAIFDRIGTEAAHRRRGLGRALMAALHAHARERGATHGLLAATAEGRALYATLGWQVRAPYASAVIERP